jgi:hypothetical protein
MENVLGNTKFANTEHPRNSPIKNRRGTVNPEVIAPEACKEGKEGWVEMGSHRASRVMEWLAARGVRRGEPAELI